MKIEAGKTYKTRDGRKVRVICADRFGTEYPVVGLLHAGSRDDIRTFTADGRFVPSHEGPSPTDLVSEWREPVTGWAVVTPNGDAHLFRTERHAREYADEKEWRIVKMVEAAE